MKKKIIATSLCLAMSVVALAGCGKKESSTDVTAEKDYASMSVDELYEEVFNGQEDYVTPGDYSKIEVTVSPVEEVTDGAVDSEIDELLSQFKYTFEGKCASGDSVNIDYVGMVDGQEFDGGSAEGYDLTLGSGTFIDDYEQQVEGMAVGEQKDVFVTFPSDYSNTDLAGKDAVFNVKLNYFVPADENATVELTDKWVETVVEVNELSDQIENVTVDGFKAYIREYLEATAKNNHESEIAQEIMNYAVDNAEKIEIPEDVQNDFINTETEADASNYGMTADEYLEAIGDNEELYNEGLITELKTMSTLLSIAKKENIKVTQEEYDSYVSDAAQYGISYGYVTSEDEFRSSYLNNYGTALYEDCLYQKVLDFLQENTTVNEQ